VFVLQLKKLVYVYLVRYAEEQQDLALLSISTFQRALKVGHTKASSPKHVLTRDLPLCKKPSDHN
jgi:hypothetical protein